MMTNAAHDNMAYLQTVRARMESAGLESPKAESEHLVRHFSKMSRVDFFAGRRVVTAEDKSAIEAALERRLSGVPLSYLFGEAAFFGYRFFVDENTLIPRPETEVLAEAALQFLDKNRPPQASGGPRILDLGTGSGILAVTLTIQRPDSKMTALDISEAALAIARRNAEFHGLGARIRFAASDLFGAFGEAEEGAFDLIVSNPPYIPEDELESLPAEVRREPLIALNGGPQGLALIEKILRQAPRYLNPGGALFMEIGLGQSGPIEALASRTGAYGSLQFIEDLNGIHRIVSAVKK
jgi:release factor glutamine methyltransferase